MPDRYFLLVENRKSGPHTVAALREMAAAHAFSEDTLVSPELAENWRAVREWPELRTILFPGRNKPTLKAKPFEVVNSSPTPHETPLSVHELLQANLSGSARIKDTPVTFQREPNRRRRDYLIICLAGNLAALVVAFFLPRTQFTLAGLLVFAAVFNVWLYWIFYQVTGRY